MCTVLYTVPRVETFSSLQVRFTKKKFLRPELISKTFSCRIDSKNIAIKFNKFVIIQLNTKYNTTCSENQSKEHLLQFNLYKVYLSL